MKTNKIPVEKSSIQTLSARLQKPYGVEVKQNHHQEANIEGLNFINSKEAAAFLGISQQSLMNLTSEGRVPYFKFGRSNRYIKNELARLILENRRGPINGLQKR